MPVVNLLIDIGNSNCKVAYCKGGELGEIYRSSCEDILSYILALIGKTELDVIVLSTVREDNLHMQQVLERKCRKLVTMHSEMDLPPHFSAGFPRKGLGVDRLAAALAVSMLFPGEDCIKFDFGTALTVDFISGNGVFQGGNISLGMTSRFKALNTFTKRLPLIEPGSNINDFGRKTAEAMESGVVLGMIFEVEGYMNKYPAHKMVFTGGDAFYFAEKFKSPIFVVPNLVLAGLALIADYYAQN